MKFAEGTAIRLRAGKLVVVDTLLDEERAARQGVTRSKLDVQLAQVAELLERKGAILGRRIPSTPEATLREQQTVGEARIRKELPDLNLFFQVSFPGKKAAEIADILNELNQLEIVEYAAPPVKVAPPPVDIPPTTPNFTANQTYFAPAPNGVDVNYARLVPGGRGEGIRVVDVENGWIGDHEDFPTLINSSGNNYAPHRDHGAAVIGEIAAVENAYGMTGIAPAVEVGMASPVLPPNDAYFLADGIQRAINQTRVGDIILIEQQVYYNYPSDQAFCPPEWDLEAYAVNQNATANGRIVILTAGNGSQNLDDTARFGNRFQRNVNDSGAIYVGAGSSTTHAPMGFSNFGSRLDVHAWGENIATLGYGDLFFPNNDARQSYAGGFGGTSGATPIVTGSASLIQAIRRARGLANLTSIEMRTALQVGATPQGAGVYIGPMPDLRDAIIAIPLPSPVITATGASNGSATISWSAIPAVAGYEVFRKDSHAGAWNLVTSTAATQFTNGGLTAGSTYLYRVRSFDGAGNRSTDSNQDIATTINFTDAQLTTSTLIRAKHIIEVRTAVNAICTFAGAGICTAPPFTGNALNEAHMQTETIKASEFTEAMNQITTLRAAIGAGPVVFRETPSVGAPVKIIHTEDLRMGAN